MRRPAAVKGGAVFGLLIMNVLITAAEIPAGWPGVFPELTGYFPTLQAPVVAKGEKPETYSQAARYDWTGGALKTLTVTLGRDPAYKKTLTPDELRKGKPAPKEVKIGKAVGWLTEAADGNTRSLVIPLGDDKVVKMDAEGDLLTTEALLAMAEKFDLAKVEKALESPPKAK